MNKKVVILTGEPQIEVLAEMRLDWQGVRGMARWVKSHRPECLPDEYDPEDNGIVGAEHRLFPHSCFDEQAPAKPLPDNELLVELAGRKCLAEGTLVQTTTGPRAIESLREAEMVMTPRGLARVVERMDNGVREAVAVETKAGYAVVCTPDHLLKTERGWVEAGALHAGDVLELMTGAKTWVGRGSLEEGYACGLFLGDGTFAGDQFRVANLRLFGDKKALMSYVERVARASSIPHRDGQALSLNSKTWGDELATYGVVHGARVVTQEIEIASSEFQRGVLMGLFDTDGSLEVAKKTRRAFYCSSHRPSLEAVQRMLLSVGVYSRLRLDRVGGDTIICGVPTVARPSYKLVISGVAFEAFAAAVGSRRRSEELRRALARPQRKSPRVTFGEVRAVHPVGAKRVYDIALERGSEHCFSANGIIAHNCYDSFGLKAGRKSNAEYIAHTQAGDIPHASILYHAKMTFFIAGVSRRVSQEIFRNYVGSNADMEGNPSQESSRFTHHYGTFVAHPALLEPENEDELRQWTLDVQSGYDRYIGYVERRIAAWEKGRPGERCVGMARKRIYESAIGRMPWDFETSFIWTTNPMALRKFFRERCDNASDLEMQRFANAWKRLCLGRWPNLFPGLT